MKKRYIISSSKFLALVIMALILVIQIVYVNHALSSYNVSKESLLILISRVCFISFIAEVIIWCRLTKEVLSPYLVFFFVLFIFTCGQSIGWATGIDLGGRDLWDRVDHGLNHELLLKGLSYSMLAVTAFHFGAIFTEKLSERKAKASKWTELQVMNAFDSLGRLALIICIPAFLAKTYQDITAVAIGGYSAFYTVNQSRSTIMSIVSIISEYYQPCMLILLIANRNKRVKRNIIVGAMLVDVILSLYIGGRSGAVMTVLGIVLAFHYFVRPITKKKGLVGLLCSYVGVAFLEGLGTIRGTAGRSLIDLVSAIGVSFSSVIGEFIGELGWTLTSTCWTMSIVPQKYPYRYGLTYIFSVLSWIPSTVFGGKDKNPVVIWSNLSDWLTNFLCLTYGSGYTTVAESYINFGWMGIIAMFVEGMVISKLIATVRRKNVNENLLGAMVQIMIIMTIMKPIVRSSLSVAFRSCAFTLIPLYVVIVFMLNRGKKV